MVLVRVSTAHYNTEEEVKTLTENLDAILESSE